MKETKQFFVRENKLNRGYAHDTDQDIRDDNLDELLGELPPADLLAQYEEIHPGFGKKLVNYLDNEQHHRHQLELQQQKATQLAAKQNKILQFSLALICAVALIILSQFVSGWVINVLVIILVSALIPRIVGGVFSKFSMLRKAPAKRDHRRNRSNSPKSSSSSSRVNNNSRRRNNSGSNSGGSSGAGRSRRRFK